MQRVVVIIPARGGSKGMPLKNIRPLGGKPLLTYSIEHRWQTAAVSRVAVSTDDDEIAGVARNYGAEVIRPPLEISGVSRLAKDIRPLEEGTGDGIKRVLHSELPIIKRLRRARG